MPLISHTFGEGSPDEALVWETGSCGCWGRSRWGCVAILATVPPFSQTASAVAIAIGVLGKCVRDLRGLMSRECVGVCGMVYCFFGYLLDQAPGVCVCVCVT